MGLGPTPTPLFQPAAFPLAPSVQPLETRGRGGGRKRRYLSGTTRRSVALDESGNLANWPPNCGKNGHARERERPLSSALMNI